MKSVEEKEAVVQMLIRVPKSVHHQVKKLATQGYRPLNSQVVLMLEAYLAAQHASGPAPHSRPS